jgi:hypothetical protein
MSRDGSLRVPRIRRYGGLVQRPCLEGPGLWRKADRDLQEAADLQVIRLRPRAWKRVRDAGGAVVYASRGSCNLQELTVSKREANSYIEHQSPVGVLSPALGVWKCCKDFVSVPCPTFRPHSSYRRSSSP